MDAKAVLEKYGPMEVVNIGTENAIIHVGDITIGGVYRGGDVDLLPPELAVVIAAMYNSIGDKP